MWPTSSFTLSALQPPANRWQHIKIPQSVCVTEDPLDRLPKEKESCFPAHHRAMCRTMLWCHLLAVTLLLSGHTAYSVQATNTDVPVGDSQSGVLRRPPAQVPDKPQSQSARLFISLLFHYLFLTLDKPNRSSCTWCTRTWVPVN